MKRRPDAGVTLIEMMVVLAIVAVMAGVATLSLNAATGERAESEAQRLAGRLRLAVDEALVTGRTLIFRWDARGYRFFGWAEDRGRWEAYSVPLLGERHELSDSLHLAARGDAAAAVRIDPAGTGDPVTLVVAGRSGSGWQIVFDGFASSSSAVVR